MDHSGAKKGGERSRTASLVVGAVGVVFGDIGTSPLYAFRECFGPGGVPITESNLLGLLSVVLWSLVVVVTLKYLFFVMRADNEGEGGILALTTLVVPPDRRDTRANRPLVMCGLFGAALLYGDGMITPAISVLSAVEGLGVAAPSLTPLVVPISIVVLAGLFRVQRYGTGKVGAIFGPITFVWFLVLGGLGLRSAVQAPEVFGAVNPWYALNFFVLNGAAGFFVLGSVLLVVTGAEALYADMGHFGRRPIRIAWMVVAGPSLLLCYFGQAALLLLRPEAVENPFFLMAPAEALYPLVLLATAATVIASQAIISGVFSLSRQALQLGYMPRLQILHSSAHQVGQVYVPLVNWLLFVATVVLVLLFQTSGALAGAYGIAVAMTMVATTILAAVCAHRRWNWSKAKTIAVAGPLLVVDLAFLGAASTKILDGGWVPLVVAGVVLLGMTTWRRGMDLMEEYSAAGRLPVDLFLADVDSRSLRRVPGVAVVMDATGEGVPRTLLHNIKHNKVLHERVVVVTLRTVDVPHVKPAQKVKIHCYREDFIRIVAEYGFMENPNVGEVLELARDHGIEVDPAQATFFFGHETLVFEEGRGALGWRKYLFDFMFRNSYGAYLQLGAPPNRVIELGQQVVI